MMLMVKSYPLIVQILNFESEKLQTALRLTFNQ